jgi:hypothetical protein
VISRAVGWTSSVIAFVAHRGGFAAPEATPRRACMGSEQSDASNRNEGAANC